MLPLFTAVILILALLDSVHAHFVWLERAGDGPVRAYFGEWIDDIREKTGGLLDRFKAPQVFLGASETPLPVKRNENNLEFPAKGRGDVRFVDSSVPPREDRKMAASTRRFTMPRPGAAKPWSSLISSWCPPQPTAKVSCCCFSRRRCPKPSSPSSVRPNGKNLSSPTTRAV